MAQFTDDDLRRLDAKFASEAVAFHARPLRAAMELLGPGFVMGVIQNPEIDEITKAYERLFPGSGANWPGMGIGLAAVGDRVRRLTAPVVMGTCKVEFDAVLGFDQHRDFEQWCHADQRTAARAYFAVADLLDLTYGLNELQGQSQLADRFWKMACSNLEDATSILANGFALASVVQPICLLAELSLKGALAAIGLDERTLRFKPYGHDHVALAQRLVAERPHRDDALMLAVANALPDFVDSRYDDAGLTRLQLVELALGAQFMAASTVRRFSSRDMASRLEADEWPGPRATLYTF